MPVLNCVKRILNKGLMFPRHGGRVVYRRKLSSGRISNSTFMAAEGEFEELFTRKWRDLMKFLFTDFFFNFICK